MKFSLILEPDSWANACYEFSDKGTGLKHNLKSMGYEGDILIRQGETTWGVSVKPLLMPLTLGWEKADTPTHRPFGKVTHPILLIIEEPEKRLSGSANNPYRKFAKHIPNLNSPATASL